MLQTFTVDKCTFALLEHLQSMPALSQARLVGGTSLALQIGHRTSIDIELFGRVDMTEINDVLAEQNFDELIVENNSKNIKQYTIDGVKVDIVNHTYDWIAPQIECDNVRLASVEDIAAMKISTITGRGSKKDFIDLYFLLQRFTLEQIIAFYVSKYPNSSLMMVYKSLSYFIDADMQQMPNMFVTVDWQDVKQEMRKQIENL